MRYPTMRYFSPQYPKGDNQLGINLDHLLMPELNELINELTTHLINETNGGPTWPKFDKFKGEKWSDVFEEAPAAAKYVYVINEELPVLTPQQVVLDHVGSNTKVKIVDADTAKSLTVRNVH